MESTRWIQPSTYHSPEEVRGRKARWKCKTNDEWIYGKFVGFTRLTNKPMVLRNRSLIMPKYVEIEHE